MTWRRWVRTSGTGTTPSSGGVISDRQAKQDRLDVIEHRNYMIVIDEPDTFLVVANAGERGDPYIVVILCRKEVST
jgi:hypothetical protein